MGFWANIEIERILKTAELCRKLETEKEKVLPFYHNKLKREMVSKQLQPFF